MRIGIVDVTDTITLPNGLMLSRDGGGELRAHTSTHHVGYVNAWNDLWQLTYVGSGQRIRRFYRYRDRAEKRLHELAAAAPAP